MILTDLFLLRERPYAHAIASPTAFLWAGSFIIGMGVLYGVVVAYLQRRVGGTLQGIPVADIPDWALFAANAVSGILITLVVHGGITIVAWLMARGIGGPGLMPVIYRTTAYLLPLGVFALPKLAVSTLPAGGDLNALPSPALYLPLAGISLALFFVGLFHVMMLTQGKGPVRSMVAVFFFAVFSFAALMAA